MTTKKKAHTHKFYLYKPGIAVTIEATRSVGYREAVRLGDQWGYTIAESDDEWEQVVAELRKIDNKPQGED